MQVKLELQVGDSKFSAEGQIAEVKSLADAFWPKMLDLSNDTAIEPAELKVPQDERQQSRKKARPSVRSKPQSTLAGQEDGLVPDVIANSIKTHESFVVMNSKILNVAGKWIDKCKLVAFVAEAKVTSGDVKRVLEALKIRADLPTISKALSGNSTDFLTTGSNPVRYEMTARALTNFHSFLEPGYEK